MTDANGPHILVVDDDLRLRTLLGKYLSENGYRVTTAADAADADAHMRGLSFDLIVLDVMMPGENGFDMTRRLRRHSQVPILLLTARGEADDRIAGLESGADDYLAKPFEPRELVLRISTILKRARRPLAEPGPLRLGGAAFDPDRAELTRDGAPVALTPAERRLLSALAVVPGAVLTREQLIARGGLQATPRTVDVQVTRLRRKIEPDPRFPRYLQTVRGEGYVLRPD